MQQLLKYAQPFVLENGAVLSEIQVAYHTYGRLNTDASNVIWVAHALSANSDAADWWSGLIGTDKFFDPKDYFIVCANMLGSHYGSTSANSVNPVTGAKYRADFPIITIRDIVKSHQLLAQHLGVTKAFLGIGGSMGGQQILEWGIIEPDFFDHITLIACGAKQSAWGVALNEAQRMAIAADPTLHHDTPDAGAKGLEAARAMAMATYRSYQSYNMRQTDSDEVLTNHRAASYQRYQGGKLSKRFSAWSYLSISRTMDSHNVARGRKGGAKVALRQIIAKTLVVGIESDMLFPLSEQAFLAAWIPDAHFEVIDSPYGHDGFLIEYDKLQHLLGKFLEQKTEKKTLDRVALRYDLGITI